ncbi:MAG: PIN domain-containing protein [Saprospiraceae bacterium]|nr:PIN domain-containing protein [Saprospiraceae bacterium]
MDSVFIDSDVILDFFINREPYADFASEIFSLCETNELHGYTSVVIISNVYYLLNRLSDHKTVIQKLNLLLTIIEIVEVKKEIILIALNSKFRDFEDALQNYSAENDPNISIILTRNLKDYKHSSLAVLTPEMYIDGKHSSRK